MAASASRREATLLPVLPFDLPGAVRRIRRRADLSQRELAQRLGMSKSAVARLESGACGLDVRVFAKAARLADLRLALLDASGREVHGMTEAGARDRALRRFPAHLDTRHGDEGWWHGPHRYERDPPWFTFDRVRWTRDHWRAVAGTPEDHHVPRAQDSPAQRAAARNRLARERRDADYRRRLAAGEVVSAPDFECTCPAVCEDLDDREGPPVHAPGCPCRCDIA